MKNFNLNSLMTFLHVAQVIFGFVIMIYGTARTSFAVGMFMIAVGIVNLIPDN